MSASLDLYCVLGNPVAHSKSPSIHAAFAAATGQRLHYERRLAPLDGFAATVAAFAEEGGLGCNVTVPFKFEAYALCPRHTERARLAGAANVMCLTPGEAGWLADNTDGVGLLRDLEHNAGTPLAGQRVLLIGAGGAAAGVLGPLLQARPRALVVANRSLDKAVALVASHAALASSAGCDLSASGLTHPGEAFDIVINASASSLAGGGAPVASGVLRPGSLAVDLMYGPAAQPFMAWAQQHQAQARDGLGMLVEQAAEAFALWRGIRPDTGPVLAALRAAVAPPPPLSAG
jgi:shikimate dehydrogenase